MNSKNAVTLLEMVIVIIIVAVMVTISISSYGRGRENTLNKEADSNLKLLQAAQRSYKAEMGTYYPSSGTQSGNDTINDNLGTALLAGSSRPWNYTVKYTGCVYATRFGGDGRSRYLLITDTDPISGTCP